MKLLAFGVPFLTTDLAKKGLSVKAGKSKTQNNSCPIANAACSKEAAVVIWKSAKPRCFKSVDTATLPMQYFSQTKAWITGEIFQSVLINN